MDLCFLCGYTICFWRLLNGYSYQQRENLSSWKTKTIWGSYSLRKSQTLNCNLNWLYDHFATYWELNSPNATFITPIKTPRAICQEYCLKHKINKVIGWIFHNFCSICFWSTSNSSLFLSKWFFHVYWYLIYNLQKFQNICKSNISNIMNIASHLPIYCDVNDNP